jgi:hypothetical protein
MNEADLRSERFVQIELAYIATALTNERVIPFVVQAAISGVIVAPDRNKQKNEHEWRHYNVDLYWKRRHGWRAGHYDADVRYEGNKRNRSRPQNQFQVGPLGRRNEAFRKSGLLDATCGRSSHHDIGPCAGEQESQHSCPGIYVKKPLLVCQRGFL